MRIAQVSPLFESVPPKLYGGTERVVSYLTEALVAAGHDVTLFASADSITDARLVPICDRSLRLDPACVDPTAHHVRQIEEVYRRSNEFDCIHFHVDYLHFPVSARQRHARVTTLHGRLDIPDLAPLYRSFPYEPLISISDTQRAPLPWANWQRTIHHGLPRDLLPYQPELGGYLAFLGRISPEKRVDRAIELARRTGIPLKIAAKVDRADRDYFTSVVRPLLDNDSIEYLGEISEHEKAEFLGKAMALLFPIDWPEPFGLVMIESLACGTPVVAWRCGSVSEVIDNGVTGFIVSCIEEAEGAIRRIETLQRRHCRAAFEKRFTSTRMASDYIRVYKEVLWAMRAQRTAAAS